jgi:hypothetical protein
MMYSSKNFCHALSVHNYLSKSNCEMWQGPPEGNTIDELDCIQNISFKHLYIKKFLHTLSVHNNTEYIPRRGPPRGNAILIMIKERSLIKNLNLMILNKIILIYGIAFDGLP